MRKVKIFSLFTAIILLFSVFGTFLPVFADTLPDFELYSEGVFMADIDTETILVSKNADKKLYPASTTKIMTCLAALANIEDLDAYVEVPYECITEFYGDDPNCVGASTAGIEPLQSNLTYRDALYSLMVCSACDSANILAYNISGSAEDFAALMNAAADAVGCGNTHFSNAHGLFSEDNYTTAYDLYLITKYAIDNYPEFTDICSAMSYDMPPNSFYPDGYTIYQTNRLMDPGSEYYCEGVCGIKTGSIDKYYYKSGGVWDMENFVYGSRSLVSLADRGGHAYLTVTLGAPYCNDDGSPTDTLLNFTDHVGLYKWAFGERTTGSAEPSGYIGGSNEAADEAEVITASNEPAEPFGERTEAAGETAQPVLAGNIASEREIAAETGAASDEAADSGDNKLVSAAVAAAVVIAAAVLIPIVSSAVKKSKNK